MRRTSLRFLTIACLFLLTFYVHAQNRIVDCLNHFGTFDKWCIREIKESAVIGGQVKHLYEFYGNCDTLRTKEPFAAPYGYYWRTNNVMAIISGVVKTSNTVYPEKRGNGYCARIETHMETVKALGIINMDVVCQGALMVGELPEPIKDTKNPMAKVLYGIDFTGRPKSVSFDYKATVGNTAVRATGFSKVKKLDYPDYPEVAVILQKRWEDKDGKMHALRVGTAIWRIYDNMPDWKNGLKLDIHYGDITGKPFYKDYMGLINDESRMFHAVNSRGDNVEVPEEGWAPEDEIPNFMIIKFLSSCGEAFCGGVGNTLWIDNFHMNM